MTNAVKFADKLSSRNIGIIVADHGDKVEVCQWLNVSTRWASVSRMIEKRWIGQTVKLSPHQAALYSPC